MGRSGIRQLAGVEVEVEAGAGAAVARR
jgi:hypothetical protein